MNEIERVLTLMAHANNCLDTKRYRELDVKLAELQREKQQESRDKKL